MGKRIGINLVDGKNDMGWCPQCNQPLETYRSYKVIREWRLNRYGTVICWRIKAIEACYECCPGAPFSRGG